MKSRIGTIVAAGLLAALVAAGTSAWAARPATPATASAPAGGVLKAYAFDSKEALAAWTIQGEAAVDAEKSRAEKGGSLKVGPGAKAVLQTDDLSRSTKLRQYRREWVVSRLPVPLHFASLPSASRPYAECHAYTVYRRAANDHPVCAAPEARRGERLPGGLPCSRFGALRPLLPITSLVTRQETSYLVHSPRCLSYLLCRRVRVALRSQTRPGASDARGHKILGAYPTYRRCSIDGPQASRTAEERWRRGSALPAHLAAALLDARPCPGGKRGDDDRLMVADS